MKNTINIKVNNEKEYNEYVEILMQKDCKQVGARLFEDERSYFRISFNQ